MKKTINKGHDAGPKFLKTPANLWDRNAQLKSLIKDGTIRPQVLHFRVKGKTPAEEYGYVVLAGEGFDMEIPGAGRPQDYYNWWPKPDIAPGATGETIADTSTCSVYMNSLIPAITERNHNPEKLGSIVRDLIRCEAQVGYDLNLTKQVAMQQAAAVAVQMAEEFSKRTGREISGADLDRAKRDARQEAGDFWEKGKRMQRKLTEEAIAQAVDFLITCKEDGRQATIPINVNEYGADSIKVICGDPDSINRLNPKRLADKINEELAIYTDNQPPIPKQDKAPSILPLVLAAGGLFVGGPIGAAGGFAIGKALEK